MNVVAGCKTGIAVGKWSKSRTDKKTGFSLIEAAIVLGVVGLVVGGIWVAASTVHEKMRINLAVSGINIISRNVTKALGPFHTTLNAINYHVFPLYLKGAEGFTDGVDPWGHDIMMDHFSDTTWQIGLYDLTKDRCMKIMVGVSASYRENNLWRMDVPEGSSPSYAQFPISLDAAAVYCANGGTLYILFSL